MKEYNVLVINPGSTSTKISYFESGKEVIKKEIHHEIKILKELTRKQEFELRLNIIEKLEIPWDKLDAIVGRGGLLKPLKSGTYRINEHMIYDLKKEENGVHASNFGGLLAKKIGDGLKIPSFIVDPVVVDEMKSIAKISGIPELERKSIFHALNQKGVAKRYCKDMGICYDESNFIVVHMGGGISIGLHEKGEVVDVNNALDGDGPFTPERAGSLPIGDFFKLYYENRYSKEFLLKRLKGDGGVTAYLGSNNVKNIMENIEKGDEKAKEIIDAMCYQIAKEIGALSTITRGKIDKIILTGGIAYSQYICDEIIKRVKFISDVVIIPGEYEMQSLYDGVSRVLSGEESVKEY